jgi:hypothetical protein
MFAALSIRIRAGIERVKVRSIVFAIVTETKVPPPEEGGK